MGSLRFRTSSNSQNKYRAKKVVVDGYTFHSIKESKRYLQLKTLMVAGEIDDLELQPRIPLMVNGKKIGSYVGDFRYKDRKGNVILEDVKSQATKTPVYNLKKKILEAQSPPIVITEVFKV